MTKSKIPLTAGKIFILVVLLLVSIPTFAQVDTAWVRRYNGPANLNDEAVDIAVDGSNNVYVTGRTSKNATFDDITTIKYYHNGDTAWVRRYNGPETSNNWPLAIAVDNSGNVYVAGTSGWGGTSDDYVTIKYCSTGDTAWVKRYNGTGNSGDHAYAIAVDGSGNVYVTGASFEGIIPDYDYCTIKYYPNGDTAWIRKYNNTAYNETDWAYAIAVDGSGNAYVTGSSYGQGTSEDYATIKYYSNGDTAWVRRYDGSGNRHDEAYAIAVDGSGNVYVTGSSAGAGTWPDYYDYVTIKYRPNGDTAWVRRYNGPGNGREDAYAIVVDGSGNVHVTGGSYGSGTDFDYATIKYYPNGDTAWVRRYNGPGNLGDFAHAIALDDSGNVYVTGASCGIGTSWDYATIKYNPNGDTAWIARYNGLEDQLDEANAITVDSSNNVYVTGRSVWSGTFTDYATIKYVQSLAPNWTILVYMNGDNNLESAAIDDINEMEMVGSSDRVSIIVEVDRIPGFDDSNGDWTDTRRYYVTSDSDPSVINSTRLDASSPLGELNMGDPQTLVDFVNWGIDNYPAERYAVVVWDHGSGWYKKPFGDGFYQDDILLKGMSFDDTDGDNIGVSDGEWESAISQIRDHLGRNIDLVGFDACLMQMWEVMDITDEYADHQVGSEETENFDGWNYTQFLSALAADPTMSAEELGKEIVDAAVDGDNQSTQSCVDLAQVSSLTTAVDNFASELLGAIGDPANYTIIHDIRTQLTTLGHEFDISSHIDLYEFCDSINIESALPSNLRTSANDVMTAIDNAVTWNRNKPAYTWANGIAIYYPADPSDYDDRYDNLPVASNTLWDDFIKFIRGDPNGDGVINSADIVYLINYLFVPGSPPPDPLAAGDANCDGVVNSADVVYLINYLFAGGPPPCS